jgi:Tol biopolymer transport system component
VRVLVVSAALVALAVLASSGAAAPAPQLLVVASNRVENSAGQIYRLDPLSRRRQNLSRGRRTWGDQAVFPARAAGVMAFVRAELMCCTNGSVVRDAWIADASGRQRNLTGTPDLNEEAPSVSPDGSAVAYYRYLPTPSGRDDVRLILHSLSGGARELLRLPYSSFEPPVWSPDGRTLLVAHQDPAPPEGTIWLVPLDGPARTVRLPQANDAAWAPSGRVVVAGSQVAEGRLDLFLVAPDGAVLRRLTRTRADERHPRPSPDGRRLAFLRQAPACADCHPRFRLWVGRADVGGAVPVAGLAGRCRGARCRNLDRIDRPEWSPNGRFLAAAVRRAHLLDLRADRLVLVDLRRRRERRLPIEPYSVLTSGPRWLGRRVVYTSEASVRVDESPAGRMGLWLLKADGRVLRRLTRDGGTRASWSPDGRRLVYARKGRLWTLGVGGDKARTLSAGSDPAWSPDGRTIAFVRDGSLHMLDVRSRRVGRVLRSRGHAEPAWSSDGTTIAFATRNWEEPELAVVSIVRPDGTGLRRIANGHGPSWSPDGRRLAFERVVLRAGKNNYWVEVWTIDASGGNPVKLAEVQQAEDDGRTAWSPDGRTILFHAAEEVYAVPAAGGPVRTLTNNPAYDADPAWRP